MMDLIFKDFPNYIEIKVVGDICLHDITSFTTAFNKHIEQKIWKPKTLVFDLEKVSSIDSTGMACLINIHKKIAPVRMYNLQESIQTMFDRIGLERVFKIYSSKAALETSSEFLKLIR